MLFLGVDLRVLPVGEHHRPAHDLMPEAAAQPSMALSSRSVLMRCASSPKVELHGRIVRGQRRAAQPHASVGENSARIACQKAAWPPAQFLRSGWWPAAASAGRNGSQARRFARADADAPGPQPFLPQPRRHGFSQQIVKAACIGHGFKVVRRGGAVAYGLDGHSLIRRHHGRAVQPRGVCLEHQPRLSSRLRRHSASNRARSPIVRTFISASLRRVAGPTNSRSPTGKGQTISRKESCEMTVTASGFFSCRCPAWQRSC